MGGRVGRYCKKRSTYRTLWNPGCNVLFSRVGLAHSHAPSLEPLFSAIYLHAKQYRKPLLQLSRVFCSDLFSNKRVCRAIPFPPSSILARTDLSMLVTSPAAIEGRLAYNSHHHSGQNQASMGAFLNGLGRYDKFMQRFNNIARNDK